MSSAPGKKQYEVRVGYYGGATITTKCVCGLPRLKARGVPHGWMPASATSAACVYLRRVGSVAGRSVLPWPPGLFGRGGTACAQRECARSVPKICVSKGVNGRGDGGRFPGDVKRQA